MELRNEIPADPDTAIQVAAKHTNVLHHATFAMIEHTPDLEVTAWNRGAEELFGYTSHEAIGQNLMQLKFVLAAEREAWHQWACEDSQNVSISTHTHKDGRLISCEWFHQPTHDRDTRLLSVVCFGRDVTDQLQQAALCEQKGLILHALVRNLPLGLWAIDPQGVFISYERHDPMVNGSQRQILGKNIFDIYPEWAPWIRQALDGKRAYWATHEENGAYTENWAVPIQSEHGQITAVVGIVLDVSKGKHLEHYLRNQLALIRKQQQVIRELSTPIIDVWDKVVMLPLVSLVDDTWSPEMWDSVLTAVAERQARFAILDLTGVDAMDGNAATYLIGLISAMRLIGTEGIVTGIRPKVAQTMIFLDQDLGGVLMLPNLKAGLTHCIHQLSRPSTIDRRS